MAAPYGAEAFGLAGFLSGLLRCGGRTRWRDGPAGYRLSPWRPRQDTMATAG
jgi:hypothetical protein